MKNGVKTKSAVKAVKGNSRASAINATLNGRFDVGYVEKVATMIDAAALATSQTPLEIVAKTIEQIRAKHPNDPAHDMCANPLQWLEAMPQTEGYKEHGDPNAAKLEAPVTLNLYLATWIRLKVMAEARGWTLAEMAGELMEDGADNFDAREKAAKDWNERLDRNRAQKKAGKAS